MVHGGERRSSSIGYCEIQPSEAPRLPNEAVICITEPTDAACGAVYWSAVGTERVVDIEAASTPPAKRVVPDEDWRAARGGGVGIEPLEPCERRSVGRKERGSLCSSSQMPR